MAEAEARRAAEAGAEGAAASEPSSLDRVTVPHPLAAILEDAARGDFPPVDGGVVVLPPDPHGVRAVVAFTGRSYVLADVPAAEVARRAPHGGFGASLDPAFLLWLAGDSHLPGRVDALLVQRGTGRPVLAETALWDDHPRVRHSRRVRRDVRVLGDAAGAVFLGSGIVGRTELSIEVAADAPAGTGRRLIADGLGHVPEGALVWAQVTPGNARSLRAFLAAGFTPVGSEALSVPRDAVA